MNSASNSGLSVNDSVDVLSSSLPRAASIGVTIRHSCEKRTRPWWRLVISSSFALFASSLGRSSSTEDRIRLDMPLTLSVGSFSSVVSFHTDASACVVPFGSFTRIGCMSNALKRSVSVRMLRLTPTTHSHPSLLPSSPHGPRSCSSASTISDHRRTVIWCLRQKVCEPSFRQRTS